MHVILWKHEYVITNQLYFNIADSRQDSLPKYSPNNNKSNLMRNQYLYFCESDI